MPWTRSTTAAVVGLLVSAAFFVPLAVWGLVDNDEGYYGLAAKLVFEGQVPYRDFFYPQAPLLPYVYGAWMQLFGMSLYAARTLSVLFALALGVLVCRHTVTRFGSIWVGVVAVTSLAATRLVSEWYTMTKTYALSTLCLFGAYMLIDRAGYKRTPRHWLAAGVLLGLAVDVRLIFVTTVPVFAVVVWRTPAAARLRAAAHWVAGVALGLLPSLILFVAAPRQFVFGNIGFHAVRSEGGLVGNLEQKGDIVEDILLHQPQYVALVVLAGVAVVWRLTTRRPPPIAFWLAATLGFVSLLPTPTYTQYFCTTIPFLIFTALELLPLVRARITRPDRKGLEQWVLVGVAMITVMFAAEGVHGIDIAHRANSTDIGLFNQGKVSSTTKVADVIDAHTTPGERVLSFRPVYIFLSEVQQVPGFENDFAPMAAETVSPEDARRLNLITNEELASLIRDRRVRLIVNPVDTHFVLGSAGRPWESRVRDAGYQQLGTYEGVTIWVRPDDGAPEG